jgi:hypothetical protein
MCSLSGVPVLADEIDVEVRSELERARRENDITSQWFDFAGARFELVDGDAEVADGVRVVATPGHTVGHQSVLVDTPDGEAVMIGDAAYTRDIYENRDGADLTQWGGPGTARESGRLAVVAPVQEAVRPASLRSQFVRRSAASSSVVEMMSGTSRDSGGAADRRDDAADKRRPSPA